MESIAEILEKEKESETYYKKKYYSKIFVMKNIVEVLEYNEPVWSGYKGFGGREMNDLIKTNEKIRKKVLYRMRNDLRRLTNNNFDAGSKFITLTFKKNVVDLSVANNEFKKFIKRLKYEEGNFKYVAVIEFQKRGAVHYHMISDLFYISNHKLRRIWSGGFVKINRIKHVDNVGAYIIKYMCKIEDARLHKRKAYLRSRNLQDPKILKGAAASEYVEKNELKAESEIYFNAFKTEHYGLVTHREFNLKQTPAGRNKRIENFIEKCERLSGESKK